MSSDRPRQADRGGHARAVLPGPRRARLVRAWRKGLPAPWDALLAPANDKAPPPENPMSADRVRWEHIQRVYELCNRNVSETARRLNMHRRTLQRILAKRAPK